MRILILIPWKNNGFMNSIALFISNKSYSDLLLNSLLKYLFNPLFSYMIALVLPGERLGAITNSSSNL
jgi:hypothetical protein